MDDENRRRLGELTRAELVSVQVRLEALAGLREVPDWARRSLDRARLLVEGVERFIDTDAEQ